MKSEIIVVTAAYGRDRIAKLGGQQALIPLVAESGADGIEIRRELFDPGDLAKLTEIGNAIAGAQLRASYSVPEALFTQTGELNPALDSHLAEAEQLQAQRIKYSLGHYRAGFDSTPLLEKLRGRVPQLVVENDQTLCGKLSALEGYFCDMAKAHASARPDISMTFDMGNWLWSGDDPVAAAKRLSPYVSYIHVKAVNAIGGKWHTVALDDADDLWRQTLAHLPSSVPRGIEFPLEGEDLVAVTRHYVDLLRKE